VQKIPIKVSKLFTANYNATKPIVINQGGTSCFAPETLIVTRQGLMPIAEVKVGDTVKCYNESTKQTEWKKVLNTFEYENHKPTIKVTLKNGQTITATEDHKFYHEGEWHSLKHLLSLRNGKMEDNTKL
tara:strand:- start:656 stop:1042 length:387 start_codon:yes stop_codon:yes gene_type:complete